MWNIKRVIEETWFFTNSNTGFPFRSNHLDYPTSDTGSYAILKILGALFQSPVAALNLYFLLGFSFVFAVSYIVLRTLGISGTLSVTGSILYTFASFHLVESDIYFSHGILLRHSSFILDLDSSIKI